MKKVQFSIRLKFIILNLIILTIFASSIMYVVMLKIKESNLHSMENELTTYATILGKSVNKETIKSIILDPNEDNPDVLEMSKFMDNTIKENSNSGIANLYLVTYLNGEIRFPTMSSSLVTDDFPFNSEYTTGGPTFNNPVIKTFKTKKPQSTEIINDQFGTWKSGFFPILDNGKVIALYGVDFDVSKVNNKAWNETKGLLILSIIFLVASGIIVAFIVSRTTRPIVLLTKASQQISSGDLRLGEIKIKTKDELAFLGNSFNLMVKNLRNIILQVSTNAEQIAAASEELTASAEQSAKASELISISTQIGANDSEEQLKSVQEAASSIEQMSASIQQTSASSMEVTKISNNASNASKLGVSTVHAVVKQMDEISETVQDISTIINTLGTRSEEIGQIVSIISGISAQTNLLALNAAIEAARAGEHGKGFAVVADEVRKLAEQSAVSAHQISDLITEIQKETTYAVQSMSNGTKKVNEGINRSHNVSESFKEIEKVITFITGNTQEVSATMEELAAVSQQIVHSIEVVKKAAERGVEVNENNSSATQEQLATMEEITASATSLSLLAEELQNSVGIFKI
jgi:methyl-accepting chemotaxis protein